MRTYRIRSVLTTAMLVIIGTAGCKGGSSKTDGDAGRPPTWVEPSGERWGELVWRGLPEGSYCYKVGSVQDVFDGCGLGVADYAWRFVGGNYDSANGTFILGDQGSFGEGQIVYNNGALMHEADTSDPAVAGCTWHQRDDTTITMVGTGAFRASVVEQHANIAPACGVSATGCTSSWTWNMWASGEKLPANNCQ